MSNDIPMHVRFFITFAAWQVIYVNLFILQDCKIKRNILKNIKKYIIP